MHGSITTITSLQHHNDLNVIMIMVLSVDYKTTKPHIGPHIMSMYIHCSSLNVPHPYTCGPIALLSPRPCYLLMAQEVLTVYLFTIDSMVPRELLSNWLASSTQHTQQVAVDVLCLGLIFEMRSIQRGR